MKRKKDAHLDFELNLIPFIDLLSTCICFLLLTAVWVQLGSMDVKQAIGGQSVAETVKKATLWIHLSAAGELQMDVQDSARVPAKFKKAQIVGVNGKVNQEQLDSWLASLKQIEPSIETALIQPKTGTEYELIINVMDQLKKNGLNDMGVVPL